MSSPSQWALRGGVVHRLWEEIVHGQYKTFCTSLYLPPWPWRPCIPYGMAIGCQSLHPPVSLSHQIDFWSYWEIYLSFSKPQSFFKILFYWNVVDLQYWVNLCYIAKWLFYIYIFSFSYVFHFYHRILNMVPFATQWGEHLFIHSIYNSIHLLIPNCKSVTSPSPPSPLATTRLLFMSVNLFLFPRWVNLCHILDSICICLPLSDVFHFVW